MREQFGRLCRLEFTNLSTKKKFTIDQSLRISFDFFKSFDESSASSTGSITIHGLTRETAEKLGNRIGNTFQTEVRCSVGYAGDLDNFQTLFVGAVTTNQYKPSRGTSETIIGVSANFKDFTLGEVSSVQLVNTTIGKVLASLYDKFKVEFEFRVLGVPEDVGSDIGAALESLHVLNWSFIGNLGEYLKKMSTTFGFDYNTETDPDTKIRTVKFSINPAAIPYYIEFAENFKKKRIYQFNARPIQEKFVLKEGIKNLYTSTNEKQAVVLSFQTGLLERPYLDNRNVKVPYFNKVADNEEVVQSKAIEVKKSKKTGEAMVDKKTGKVKLKIPKNKTINRRFLSAKALINPDIKPNSMIRIAIGVNQVDGIYRARNCKFKGDTHDGEWSVEMELEDTEDSRPEVAENTLPSENSESTEVIGN